MERIVKVAIMPGKVTEVVVNGERTARELFEMAGIEVDNSYEVKVNGATVELDEVLEKEVTLVLASKKIKGNNSLRVAVMPGKIVEVAFEGGKTVKELFEMADLTVDNSYEVKLDGVVVSLEDTVTGGSLLLASKKIKGNR